LRFLNTIDQRRSNLRTVTLNRRILYLSDNSQARTSGKKDVGVSR